MTTQWNPTHRHIKTGGFYRFVGEATIEADMTPAVVYQGANGQWWVRPRSEFNERFARLEDSRND